MQAVVQKLSDAPFNTYANQYLQYRANYVLVKVFRKYSTPPALNFLKKKPSTKN